MSRADDIDPSLPANAIAGSATIEASSASASTGASEAIGRADAAIAEALATGRIDSIQAQELLLAEVVAEQLPASASPESIAGLTSQLRELLADDPTLARLLSPS